MTLSTSHSPWNKGKRVGQKLPLKLEHIWAIRIRLEIAEKIRELAMFTPFAAMPTLPEETPVYAEPGVCGPSQGLWSPGIVYHREQTPAQLHRLNEASGR